MIGFLWLGVVFLVFASEGCVFAHCIWSLVGSVVALRKTGVLLSFVLFFFLEFGFPTGLISSALLLHCLF